MVTTKSSVAPAPSTASASATEIPGGPPICRKIPKAKARPPDEQIAPAASQFAAGKIPTITSPTPVGSRLIVQRRFSPATLRTALLTTAFSTSRTLPVPWPSPARTVSLNAVGSSLNSRPTVNAVAPSWLGGWSVKFAVNGSNPSFSGACSCPDASVRTMSTLVRDPTGSVGMGLSLVPIQRWRTLYWTHVSTSSNIALPWPSSPTFLVRPTECPQKARGSPSA